jgi:hypothetical protein
VVDNRLAYREELIFLLNQATELEHSLCCSYLFTAFSLKSSVDDGLPEDTVETVKGWKDSFIGIAIEEMFHLTMINDLLVAIGSAPNLDRSNFPHGCSYYMPELHIELHAFSEETMRHFIAIEQPAGSTLPLRQNAAMGVGVLGDMDNEIGPDPHILASQGDVYDIVLRGLKQLAERIGEENVFIGPPASPALERFLNRSGWEPVRSIAAVERTFARIVEEGEGGAADSDHSHYARFDAILKEYLALKEKHPSFEPAFPVLENPFGRTPPEASGPVNLMDDVLAVQISDLFNEVYTAMLHVLARYFVPSEESEQEVGKLMSLSMMVMRVLDGLGEQLARLPAGPSQPGFNAGPSFVVGTLHPMPYKTAAWYVLKERFEELRDYTAELAAKAEDRAADLAQAHKGLERVAAMLAS